MKYHWITPMIFNSYIINLTIYPTTHHLSQVDILTTTSFSVMSWSKLLIVICPTHSHYVQRILLWDLTMPWHNQFPLGTVTSNCKNVHNIIANAHHSAPGIPTQTPGRAQKSLILFRCVLASLQEGPSTGRSGEQGSADVKVRSSSFQVLAKAPIVPG